jgi:protein-export membrane protein SecD
MRLRLGVILGTVLVSLFILIPSFLPEGSQWARFFPSPRINLGLDLRGGIHIVLGVDVQRALDVDLDKYSVSLQDQLKGGNLAFESVTRSTSDRSLLVRFRNPQEMGPAQALITEQFFGVLVAVPQDNNSLRVSLDSRHADELVRMSLEQAREIIRNRVDEFGVAEPTIQLQGEDRILVQLPGVKDPERAIQLIGRTALLEFRLVDSSVTEVALNTLVDKVRDQVNFRSNFTRRDLEALNAALRNDLPEGTEIAFERIVDPRSGDASLRPYLIQSQTLLTGQGLEDAFVSADQTTQRPQVSLRFNKLGAETFEKVTTENVGELLAILLDGSVVSAPVIRERIPAVSAGATISLGRGSPQEVQKEARDLALVLRSGALPAPVEILENRTVGASLGEDSIASGQKAALIGALIVILFMVLYYRWSGALADLALAINLLMLTAFMALFQATLTLPGIAGIVLTIGMAVDANVIILERIRDELKLGKKVRAAVEAGYSAAHSAIFDSNLTTLIAGLVLYNFGSGPVRGFAVTLMIGLVANYITAVWFSRWIYQFIFERRQVKELSI